MSQGKISPVWIGCLGKWTEAGERERSEGPGKVRSQLLQDGIGLEKLRGFGQDGRRPQGGSDTRDTAAGPRRLELLSSKGAPVTTFAGRAGWEETRVPAPGKG